MKQHHHLSVFFILMLTTVTFTGCFESLQVPEQDSRNEGNYSWTFDFETHVLTITGSGAFKCDLELAYYNAYYHYYSYYREIIEKVIIEDGITSIGENVFWECKSLNSVTIPNSVTSIGKKAFYNCSSLTSITIGDKVTDIGDEAFSGCSSLPSIEIPNSVASINEKAFFGCSSLKSVIWNAENCADFKSAPFVDCPITSFTLSDEVEHIPAYLCRNMDKLKSIKLPNSVTSIGIYAFVGCNGLNSPIYSKRIFAYMPTSYSGAYSIPDGIEIIIECAFYNCNYLTSIEIPNSVTSIGYGAIRDCSNLNLVTLGNSVKIIDQWAFDNCSKLTTLICKAETPPTTVGNVFCTVNDNGIPSTYYEQINLYVPAESMELYKKTHPWSSFKSISAIVE